MIAIYKICCFIFGHGEFKTYWKQLDECVSSETMQCELCGTEQK